MVIAPTAILYVYASAWCGAPIEVGPGATGETATATRAEPGSRPRGGAAGGVEDRGREERAPDALGEAPLTDEELALLAALDARTATIGLEAVPSALPRLWPAPSSLSRAEVAVTRAIIRESIARSISEALESEPLAIDTPGRVTAADSALIRGLGGHRLALSLDGMPLRNASTPSAWTPELLAIDPWMIEEAAIERPGSLESSPSGSAGAIALAGLRPRGELGTEAELELSARSADRSTAAHGSAAATSGVAAIRVAAGYSDLRPLRVATTSTAGRAYQHAAVSARARLFGRQADPLEVRVGIDLDRLSGLLRTDLDLQAPPIERGNQRLSTFARASAGRDDLRFTLFLARQTFRTELDPAATSAARYTESAGSWFATSSLRWAPMTALALWGGALIDTSDATLAAPASPPATASAPATVNGRSRTLSAFAGAELALERLSGQVTLSVVSLSSSLGDGPERRSIDTTRLLAQSGARLRVAGPLGVRADFTQGAYVPSARDLRDGAPTRSPETSLSIDLGPSLFAADAWIELLGFYTQLKDALEPENLGASRLLTIEQVDLAGIELAGGWLLFDRLRFAGTLAWAEGKNRAGGASIIVSPSVTGRASVRYDFGARGAFVEAHLRGTSRPLTVFSAQAIDFAPRSVTAPATFVRVGVLAGTDLGLGFRFQLALENLLDAPNRVPASLVPNAGVDLRVALSYAWR